MDLYLKIDADENHQFFEKYDQLSSLRKKIWRKIVDISNRWIVAKPSQKKIASWCGCSRSAVSEAFRLFREYGWLTLKSRGALKSKIIQIPHSKRQLDLVERKYFKNVRATYRATHTSSYTNKYTSMPSEIEIPYNLEKLDIPIAQKLKLSLLPTHILYESYSITEKKSKNGLNPEKLIPYWINTGIGMAKKEGIPLPWRNFGYTLEKLT